MALRALSKALDAPVEYVLAAARVGTAQGLLVLDEAGKPKTIAFPYALPLEIISPGTPAPPARRPFAVEARIKPGMGPVAERFAPLTQALMFLSPRNEHVSFKKLKAQLPAMHEIQSGSVKTYLSDAVAAGHIKKTHPKIADSSFKLLKQAQPAAQAPTAAVAQPAAEYASGACQPVPVSDERFDLLYKVISALRTNDSVPYTELRRHLLKSQKTRAFLGNSLETYLRDAAAADKIKIVEGPEITGSVIQLRRKERTSLHLKGRMPQRSDSVAGLDLATTDVPVASTVISNAPSLDTGTASPLEEVPVDLTQIIGHMRARFQHVTIRTLRKYCDGSAASLVEQRCKRAEELGLLVYGGDGNGAWVRLPEHVAVPKCALCSAGRY
jgi:hypothetical protein